MLERLSLAEANLLVSVGAKLPSQVGRESARLFETLRTFPSSVLKTSSAADAVVGKAGCCFCTMPRCGLWPARS